MHPVPLTVGKGVLFPSFPGSIFYIWIGKCSLLERQFYDFHCLTQREHILFSEAAPCFRLGRRLKIALWFYF